MNELTAETFIAFIKEQFSVVQHSQKRIVLIGIDFAKSLRAVYGDDKFYAWLIYAWLNSYEIQCGAECYDYISEFVKEYESRNS